MCRTINQPCICAFDVFERQNHFHFTIQYFDDFSWFFRAVFCRDMLIVTQRTAGSQILGGIVRKPRTTSPRTVLLQSPFKADRAIHKSWTLLFVVYWSSRSPQHQKRDQLGSPPELQTIFGFLRHGQVEAGRQMCRPPLVWSSPSLSLVYGWFFPSGTSCLTVSPSFAPFSLFVCFQVYFSVRPWDLVARLLSFLR